MAGLIKSSRLLGVSGRFESAAAEARKPRPTAVPERGSEAPGAAHSDRQAKLDASAQFRADMHRRYVAPLTPARCQSSGVNAEPN
jgi:hypothetical protein